jgi:serine/threonine protein kinase
MAFCPHCGAPQGDRARTGISATLPPPPPEVAQADPLVGSVIADRYRIVSVLGRGGMGVVYKAEHVRIGKVMAIKLLHGELARDKDVVKRFKREADLVSRLSHPNTVQIFDFGRTDNLMYLVMEYVEGRDLGRIIQQEHTLPFSRVAKLAAQVCASLAESHAKGVVHRDLKPENVMIAAAAGHGELVKVLDFGLAKLRDQRSGEITRAGSLVGTPYYMAPEYIRGEEVDGRADLYAIGAMIYKAVCAVPPFTGKSPVAVLTKHLTETLVLPSARSNRADLPPECDAIVARAMQRDPRDRYQSAEELRADLLAYLDAIGESVDSSPRVSPRSMSGVQTVVPRTEKQGRPAPAVATRSDVDRYEARLRRNGRLRAALLVSVFAAAVGGAAWAWQQREIPVATTEREPNDIPAKANALPPGRAVRGFLGQRMSTRFSDADVYALANPGGRPRFLRFSVSAIPNMDLVVDVVRAGHAEPLVRVDGAPLGAGEAVPALPFDGPLYYLRVRENWREGVMPTENISDSYEIRWDFVEPAVSDEREVNDSAERANGIRVGGPRTGTIGWNDDRDVYCLEVAAERVQARVSGVEGLDLVLESVERVRGVTTVADDGAVGAPEALPPVLDATAQQTCFVVRASTARGGARARVDGAYTLTLEVVDLPPPPAPSPAPTSRGRERGRARRSAVPGAGGEGVR